MTTRELKSITKRQLDKGARVKVPIGGGEYAIKNISTVYFDEDFDCWMIQTR